MKVVEKVRNETPWTKLGCARLVNEDEQGARTKRLMTQLTGNRAVTLLIEGRRFWRTREVKNKKKKWTARSYFRREGIGKRGSSSFGK